MSRLIERQIRELYNKVFNQLFTGKKLTALSKGSRVDIIEASKILTNSKKYNDFANKFAIELAKKGLATKRGTWRKYYAAAKRLHYISLPKTFTEYEAKVMSKAVKQNLTMIKTIPSEVVKLLEHKYTSTLIEEVAKGKLTRGSFRRQLESHGHKNAKCIARTETSKLQTAIAESRATELGSVSYIWLSSNDRRTRKSHRDMNGVVVFWRPASQKPLLDNMRGNAGEFPNCRCDTQPIVDYDDLTKHNYRVYDYNHDKIIVLSKNELIEALKRGSLD